MKRNEYLDFLKGISIIFVVLGHCIQYGSGDIFIKKHLFFYNVFFKIIYSFHMPLFMIISGYLFYFSIKEKSIEMIIQKKFISIGIPIIFWGIVNWIIELGKSGIDDLTFIKLFQNIIYNLWFLWAILGCSFFLLVNKIIFKDSLMGQIIILVSFYLLPDKYNLIYIKYLYPFFIIGYYMNKNFKYSIIKNKIKNLSERKGIILLLLLLFFILVYNFKFDYYIYNSKHSIFNEEVEKIVISSFYRLIIGMLGIVLINNFSFLIYFKLNEDIKKFFIFCGKSSLEIYIISSYINYYALIPITKNINNNFAINLIQSLVIIIICLIIKEIISKNKIVKKLMFGKK